MVRLLCCQAGLKNKKGSISASLPEPLAGIVPPDNCREAIADSDLLSTYWKVTRNY